MTAIRFRTEMSMPAMKPGITHQSRLLLVGSCFSDEVGERLGNSGFDVTVNPTGTLYNP
ncbi:MAG: GSCFA domain-containing protein, partial [Muribaculaceae bacterium]|nr:GSCFA domain-containing protein [Muribaculaceae bacterium]